MKTPFISQDIAFKSTSRRFREVGLIQTKSKDSIITPQLVGLTFLVYNGKKYKVVVANATRIGHKLGEFVLTKKRGSQIHISEHNRRRAKKASDIRLGLRKKKKKQ